MDSRLAEWVGWLDTTKWSVFVLDRNRKVVWASEAFKDFLRERDDVAVGVGKHIIEAIASPLWLSILSPDSVRMLADTALPYFLPENPEARAELGQRLVEPIRSAVAAIPRRDEPDLWSGGYEYLPGPGLDPLRTNYLVFRLREPGGELLGSCVVSMLALRPALLGLLARGDEGMYERMASLVTPARHQTAILFADLQGSGDISRRMPTTHYFDLISRLTTHFDATVAANAGIVGKHAGDGWTAFFLVGDAGSAETAAAGAVRSARAMQEEAQTLMRHDDRLPQLCVNAGLHWGPNLYMGQLVPGGRLDVTALGDEVNECARLQETARDGAILASKSFMEVLSDEMCRVLELDGDGLVYQPLGAHDTATEKALRDAGTIAVCRL